MSTEEGMDSERVMMRTLEDQATWFAEIQKYLVAAACDLFGAYGVPVQHSFGGAVDTRGQSVMSVLGYGAESVRGSVVLLTSRHVVDVLRPAELQASGLATEDVLLRDVLGEFANMLLGRVKNKLSTRSFAPMLATPTTVLGDDLALPAPRSGLSAWHRFAAAEGDIFVRLDATFEPHFALDAAASSAAQPMREGDVFLFPEG